MRELQGTLIPVAVLKIIQGAFCRKVLDGRDESTGEVLSQGEEEQWQMEGGVVSTNEW